MDRCKEILEGMLFAYLCIQCRFLDLWLPVYSLLLLWHCLFNAYEHFYYYFGVILVDILASYYYGVGVFVNYH